MLEKFTEWLVDVDDIVWGIPMIVLILAVGIYLTVRMGGLQVRHLGKALKFMVKNEEGGDGDVTSFGALCTAMSATIGTGNIVGVATAIAAGGPGALFWMWIAAFFGMATKYAEGVLAIKYRTKTEDGHILGGPFYYIENGMGTKWKFLGKMFAIFGAGAGLLGIGTFTQISGITSAIGTVFESKTIELPFGDYSLAVIIGGFIVGTLVALVILGGLKRIAKVSEIVVPFMAIIYVLICILILVLNFSAIPAAIVEIVESAFGVRAVAGGALGTILISMQKGIARGIFSNEAGLGSAPIAAAAAKTKEPVRQGLVSMTGTFIDTIVICTMTGLSIVIGGSWTNSELEGVNITIDAFQKTLPFSSDVAATVLMTCLAFFAFTTILGWNYYGERCTEYLCGGKKSGVKIYRYLYIAAVFIGPYMTVKAVWTLADIFNGLMALPNLVAIIALSGVVAAETKKYFSKQTLKPKK